MLLCVVLGASTLACASIDEATEHVASAEVLTCALSIDTKLAHDRSAFTQGFAFDNNGRLFESTGHYGESQIRELNVETGEIVRSLPLDEAVFGEGVDVVDNQLVQLTWKSGTVYFRNKETLEVESTSRIDGEGWGIAADTSNGEVIVSDGTATLRVFDANSVDLIRTIDVTENGVPVTNLNELELIEGVLYANVWETPFIVAINIETGAVVQRYDGTALYEDQGFDTNETNRTLNGIARRNSDGPGEVFLTGKYWDSTYRVTWCNAQ